MFIPSIEFMYEPVLLTRDLWFPDPCHADKHGLLALGGDLSPERLLLAYASGIFPWFSPGDPVLWWSPDPRMVLVPTALHVPRRLLRIIRRKKFRITLDMDFDAVISACSLAGGREREGTWITRDMIRAYAALHSAGYAHSVEAWHDERLAGGLYGVAMGAVFFGESMFFNEPDASKVAFVYLVNWLADRGVKLIDCQVRTHHLARFGAGDMARDEFISRLMRLRARKGPPIESWMFDHEDQIFIK